MRFAAPARDAIDPVVFARPPLAHWHEFGMLLRGAAWPSIEALNELVHNEAKSSGRPPPRFVAQTPALLADGMHYERRIAERGQIATRERNWHDLLNALVWSRFPQLKWALNGRQVAEIAVAGPRQRTRAQCALTHFDEAGVVVMLRDPALLALWDAHDWHGLFWTQREAWSDGRIDLLVFGHALLEHALRPAQLLVGKALVVALPQSGKGGNAASPAGGPLLAAIAAAIRSGRLLADPQELRPLPLSGIPGWHPDNVVEDFHREAPCFRPLRSGRCYPKPFDASMGTRGREQEPGDREDRGRRRGETELPPHSSVGSS